MATQIVPTEDTEKDERPPLTDDAREVAVVATTLNAEALESWVASQRKDDLAPTLLAVNDAQAFLRAAGKCLTQRMVIEGMTGGHFTIAGRGDFDFYGSVRKGWEKIPELVANCLTFGMTALDFALASPDFRVTDLRTNAQKISDPEKRDEALAFIEQHRIAKGARGVPTLRPSVKVLR